MLSAKRVFGRIYKKCPPRNIVFWLWNIGEFKLLNVGRGKEGGLYNIEGFKLLDVRQSKIVTF